ncbi:hypothetical protein WT02_23235 [Burkholderia stagnalis]|nr:hypothetical protein WT02_23235 [Burkholderia stagnalis]KVL93721.1 hypothetical protein WT03_14810 [Burkholderia stagnalis]KVM02145.1 hypothetical protein WT04_30575 [Burkholderia stagnalis]
MFVPNPPDELGPTDEPASQYRFGYNTALEDVLDALANETGAEVALGYAQRLATGLWEKHWRDSAPQWKVLDDTLGVLTQIDNMVCGLSRSPAMAAEAVAIPAGWRVVPEKITRAMIEAAMESHYGKQRARQNGGAGGIVMTVNDTDWTGVDAMRRFWKGALAAAPQPPAQADAWEGLTDEQRSSCAVAADLAHANGLKSIANDLRVLAAYPGEPEPRAEVTQAVRTYPDELTDTLRHVLSFPNFRCAPYAHLMRAAGADIKTKAEDEQAHVLHWLVKLVIDHGERWADIADQELTAMRGKVDAARAGEGQ